MMMGVVGLKSRANIAYCVYLATLTLYNNSRVPHVLLLEAKRVCGLMATSPVSPAKLVLAARCIPLGGQLRQRSARRVPTTVRVQVGVEWVHRRGRLT